MTADQGPKSNSRFRIGYWISEKKCRKFNLSEFLQLCRSEGLEPIQIDLDRPLEEQGPFTLILHKLTDVIAKAMRGDLDSQKTIQAFQTYVCQHPEVIVVDPLESINYLLDRTRTYEVLNRSEMSQEDALFTPAFVELTTTNLEENVAKLKAANVTFPIICKPTVAHGSSLAHQMSLIFNEESLKDVNPPCVAQTFINHNAILYKLYVIGDKWHRVDRPSLKNFYPGDHKTIFFDSHSVSKADSDCLLNKLDKRDLGIPVGKPTDEKLQKIVSTVNEILGMGLYGIDVVIDCRSERYAIVDINAFPGYDGVVDFTQLLIQYMREQIRKKECSQSVEPQLASEEAEMADTLSEIVLTSPSANQTSKTEEIMSVRIPPSALSSSSTEPRPSVSVDSSPEDSGIDTGDSSDEKKNKRLILPKVIRRVHSKCSAPSTADNAQPQVN
ncbi:hypothetical protein CHUAL_012287 [Chamberlinius hualienensis]